MAVVYIDKVFVLNLMIDYLLLLTAARLAGAPLQRGRLLCGAALGAVYAVAVFLPGCAALGRPLGRLTAGVVMNILAFWKMQRQWRIICLSLLLSAALAGIVMALGLAAGSASTVAGKLYYAQIGWPMLLGTACGMYVLLHMIFRQGARHGGGELMRVAVKIQGKERELLALHDTGNTLRDPISGQPILVIEQEALRGIWDPEIAEILYRPLQVEEKIARLHHAGRGIGFTLLPFRSVGAAGLLLAVRSDSIRVERMTYRHAWVALSERCVSDGGAYRALWGGTVRGEDYSAISEHISHMASKTQQAG